MDVSSLLKNKFLRYVASGLATVATDVGGLYILVHFFGVQVYLAATVSYLVSLVVNFGLNKLWTFEAGTNTSYHMVAYGLVIGLNYLVGLGMIALAQHIGAGYLVGKVAALVITTGWNFFIYKYVVFVTDESPWVAKPKALLKTILPKTK
jgi:putative flippase GtrA